MNYDQTIIPYYSIGAHAIEAHSSISLAMDVMRQNQLRHLPVLHEGKVVGEISERDLRVWGLKTDVSKEVSVRHIMQEDPYLITTEASIHEVASEMAERKIGCAIVVEEGRLLGIFTVTDALRALARLTAES